MNLTDVQSSGKRFFTLESGRLLITDPGYYGYSKKIEDELIDKRGQRPVTYFPQGASYYYPEDSLFNVYRKNNGLWIARHTTIGEAIERTVDKQIFGLQGQLIFPSKNKEKQKEREMKKRGFLFLASTDVCTMLIGDQEIFGLNESQFDLSHKLRGLSDEKKKDMEEAYKENSFDNHKKVVKMTPGRYSCRAKPNGLEVNLL